MKTNVLFFTRGETDRANTKEVWLYDLRANTPQFGKRTQLTREHFGEFETAFGDDPLGGADSLARRVETGEAGRFRRFTREEIAARNDSLDIAWLKDDDSEDPDDLPEPGALAQEAITELKAALEELRSILADRLEADYAAARTHAERLTPALLAKAFRGELVPRDPNDEPASVLLERIRAGRMAEGVTGSSRRSAMAASGPRFEVLDASDASFYQGSNDEPASAPPERIHVGEALGRTPHAGVGRE